MKYLSLCSGIEAASVAWSPLGWEPVAFSEIEKFPCKLLEYRFPQVPNIGDMTKIDGRKYRGAVDLIVGGTPCQGFSIAGNRGGLSDERSGLALHFVRILSECRPRWILWENVPGAFSTGGRRDFGSFLRALAECGYHLAWRVLDARFSECPSDAVESSLSDILETGAIPQRYFLSAKACEGLLRRAENRGKAMPVWMEASLRAVVKSQKV